MVKMALSEVRTQTADIKSYCQSLKEGANHLNLATEGLVLELGISGTTGNSIKSYLSAMYPALAKAMLLHAQSLKDAIKLMWRKVIRFRCAGKANCRL